MIEQVGLLGVSMELDGHLVWDNSDIGIGLA